MQSDYDEHPASSCMAFCRSEKAKKAFDRLMKTGDVAEPKAVGNCRMSQLELEAEVALMHKLHMEGMSLSELARKFGIYPSNVTLRFKNRGLKVIDGRKSKKK